MDIEHCLTVRKIRSCEVQAAADKTLTQRLLYMFVVCLPPVRTSVRTTAAKLAIFFQMMKQRLKKEEITGDSWICVHL